MCFSRTMERILDSRPIINFTFDSFSNVGLSNRLVYYNAYRNYTMNSAPYATIDYLKLENEYMLDDTASLALTNKYDCKKAYSWVIKIDPCSFFVDSDYAMGACKLAYIELYKQLINWNAECENEDTILRDLPWLGVTEKSNKCIHAHFTTWTNRELLKIEIAHINRILTGTRITIVPKAGDSTLNETSLNTLKIQGLPWSINADNGYEIKLDNIVTFEKIKSVSGYLNYLRKAPLQVIYNQRELIKYYINFSRTHVFQPGTTPKFTTSQMHVLTNNPLVLLFFKLFKQGKWSYNDILKSPSIQCYLQMPALHSIYTNCIQQYMSTHSHLSFLIDICERYLELQLSDRCFCPVIEWLTLQEISIEQFMTSLVQWMNGIHKKNALLFIGAPNVGKSHVGRLIWQQFPFHKRILQDGIFTFANLFNSGCGLWDEPFIAPDLADTTKLVLEGDSKVEVAIKNQGSKPLGKRVPLVITSNNELHKYCSGEAGAIEERVHRFDCFHVIDPEDWCKANKHYCPFIDHADSTPSPFARTFSDQVESETQGSTPMPGICNSLHKITEEHILSILASSLCKFKTVLEPFPKETFEHQKKLYDLIDKCKGANCYLSNQLLTYKDIS